MRVNQSNDPASDYYLTLLDKFPTLVWRSDINAKCNYFNQAWLGFTGRSMKQEMGDGWTKGVHPEDLADCIAIYLKAFHARQPFALEYRLRRHDGEYRWILDQGNAFHDAAGRFAGYMGSCFDITERKLSEAALLESKRFLRSTLDALSSHIAILDEQGTIIEVNAAWRRFAAENHFFGGHGVGDNYLQVCDSTTGNCSKEAPTIARGIRAIIAGRSNEFSLEYPCHSPKAKRWFIVRATRFQAMPLRVVVAHENITGRKRIEARFRRLVDSNAQGVLFWNMKGEVTEANDAFLKLVQYSRKDLETGRINWAAMTPPEYAHLNRLALDEIAASGVCTAFEKEFIRKDGVRVPILIGAAALEDNPDEGVCFVIDRTEHKEAELALQNSHAQLRALSGRLQNAREQESERIAREIHDELGQELTNLNMDLAWIKQKVAEAPSPQLRSQLKRRITSMTALLESTVRSVQRIATALRPAMLDELGLTATLEWQAEEFAARTGIRCRWRPKPATVQLNRGHATAVFRIFQEILTNVARHARASSLALSLVGKRAELILEVVDDGIGFDPAKLQGHKSLGLLGMRERAAFIGGSVEVLSTPGSGTKIIGKFPAAKLRKPGKLKGGTSRGKTIKNSHR